MKRILTINRLYLKYIIKWSFILLVIISLFGFIGYSFILYGGKLIVDEEALILKTTTTIETTDGEVITEIYQENRHPIDINEIPEHVIQAFIAIEDRRFYQHAGIDFKSIVRAVYRDIIAFSKVEGASTITQQLAKNLFLSTDKTWMRKTKEAMAAIYLEQNFSKDEILELYLNAIYFGHGAYGIEAAANKFFSKSAKDLTIAEGALLAGVINAPSKYSPIDHPEEALQRRQLVLKNMAAANFISVEKSLSESGKTLGLQVATADPTPWNDSYIDLVLKEAAQDYQLSFAELQRGGYKIVVHLNELMQKIAYDFVLEDKYFPGNRPGVEAAFVMLDHQTGHVLAALGGRDYELGDLNRLTVRRQPGSTLKPLAVYGPALMQDTFHPFTLIQDELKSYDGYVARNYDGIYDGETTIYDALMYSKNAPAVWLLNEIGIDYAKEYLAQMNLLIEDDDLAIALGGLKYGLTPLQMAASYQMIANAGVMINPTAIEAVFDHKNELIEPKEPVKQRVFSSQVAWHLIKMMEATVSQGTAQVGVYEKALAGKTGSTEHPRAEGFYKDAWFIGFTPNVVTALWMGYDHSDENHYLTKGSRAPTELTKDILTEIDKHFSLPEAFQQPEDVDDLPEPIELPEITNVNVTYKYSWWPLFKGELTWSGASDERIVYNIYEEKASGIRKIGQVTGESSFIIDDVSVMNERGYFIIPFDPLTGREGKPSETVILSW